MRPNTTALTRATLGTIWFVVIITIGGELFAPFKGFFTSIAGQHWAGKSIMSVMVFGSLYLTFMKSQGSERPEKGIYGVIASAIVGGLLIFAFFVWHFLSA